MNLNRIAPLLIACIAIGGCGSEQTPDAPNDKPEASAPVPKPKSKSARVQMIECIEGVGFEVTHDDQDAATATNFTVEDDKPQAGWLKAVVIIHADADTAERSAAQGRAEDDLDDTAVGRAEFITHAADETEARVIGACVEDSYGS